MKIIPLTQGKEALVDDEDYEYLKGRKWHAIRGHGATDNWKALGQWNGRHVQMHRLIMGVLDAPKGVLVDHINGNGLDNTRKNLRIVNSQQNMQNQRRGNGKFKGVRYRNGAWYASITKNLGKFETEEDAARAYNEAALLMYGEYAALNDV